MLVQVHPLHLLHLLRLLYVLRVQALQLLKLLLPELLLLEMLLLLLLLLEMLLVRELVLHLHLLLQRRDGRGKQGKVVSSDGGRCRQITHAPGDGHTGTRAHSTHGSKKSEVET